MIERQWKTTDGNRMVPGLQEKTFLPYLVFPKLQQCVGVRHLFSTRMGGVSAGEWSSMNLSFSRGDEKTAVEENFRRIAEALGYESEDLVSTDQTHTDVVRVVTKKDKGHGIVREKEFFDTDGLITKESGVVLSAFFADCVPLFFADKTGKGIGLSHSGWKGTMNGIGAKTVQKMQAEFGCNPEDILVAIGPSICRNCYEVSEDLLLAFRERFYPVYGRNLVPLCSRDRDAGALFWDKGNGKYHLDLWRANLLVLENAGILPEHIEVTNVCTCCNSKYLFSHRASKGRRGNLGAFIVMEEDSQRAENEVFKD